jgi:hypothetical protein
MNNIATNKKLQLSDIKRISNRINSSIFDENICSVWSGYITNTNNTCKGMYVNFYFRKKKVALHRLLYCNYVGDLNDDEYLKFNCENKGRCCNIHHMNKFKYNINENDNEELVKVDKKPSPVKNKIKPTNKKSIVLIDNQDNDVFTLKFD